MNDIKCRYDGGWSLSLQQSASQTEDTRVQSIKVYDGQLKELLTIILSIRQTLK